MFRNALLWLTVVGLLLPAAICLVIGLAGLLWAVGDETGARFTARLGLAGGLLWMVDLVSLVLVQAVARLMPPDQPPEE